MIKLYPSIPFIFLTLNIFFLDKNALMLNNQNMGENLWKNGLLFKLKIGRENEIAGEAERESATLESTFGVCDDRDFAIFASSNLFFFLRFQFLLR